jgi:hypothetical protein
LGKCGKAMLFTVSRWGVGSSFVNNTRPLVDEVFSFFSLEWRFTSSSKTEPEKFLQVKHLQLSPQNTAPSKHSQYFFKH